MIFLRFHDRSESCKGHKNSIIDDQSFHFNLSNCLLIPIAEQNVDD